MNRRVTIGLLLLLAVQPAWADTAPKPASLSLFYQSTGQLYAELKHNTARFIARTSSASEYLKQMHRWRANYQALNPQAPCPKNHWQRYYPKLTPAHYALCFAWSDLGSMYTALLAGRSTAKDVIYFEGEFRKEMAESAADIAHPAPETSDW